MFWKKKIETENVVKAIYKKDLMVRYANFLLGILLVACAYNLLLVPSSVVYGVGGIGVMLKHLYGFDPSLVILIGSAILLIISYFTLGKEKTFHSAFGSFLYPVFVKLTQWIPEVISIEGAEMILIVIIGAVMTGFGLGLIFKAGFSTGGTDILNQVVSKYGKMSIGNAMLITDGLIILASGLVFGFTQLMYSLISLYIISIMSDKVIIGISQSKAFYVITSHETAIKKFILSHLSHGVTVFDVRGGFTGNNQKMIMFIIPTKEYFFAKEGILEIDPNAFFVVTDAYEVSGGE